LEGQQDSTAQDKTTIRQAIQNKSKHGQTKQYKIRQDN
jgi:hypothetical protein